MTSQNDRCSQRGRYVSFRNYQKRLQINVTFRGPSLSAGVCFFQGAIIFGWGAGGDRYFQEVLDLTFGGEGKIFRPILITI